MSGTQTTIKADTQRRDIDRKKNGAKKITKIYLTIILRVILYEVSIENKDWNLSRIRLPK